ncbi:MAG: recombinase family protein [Roseicyclus sp.]|nr:recombinase family protein [Roseicyclus sp.]MBO6924175.1 recombinase family protein [Roseicyclus sp.]
MKSKTSKPAKKRYVIYRRVSTKRQGDSGLGLEAQDRDIALFLENYSDVPYEVIGTFTDIQSGKHASRPELDKALSVARSEGAELLVAKLDRLSRRVSQIAALMEDKKLTIRVASMPQADPFQLHIYSALAEQERRFISLRTRQALAAAKARGVELGGMRDATMKRNAAAKEAANAAAQRVSNIIVPMRDGGATLQSIADALNAAKVPTPRNRQWAPMSVKNVLDRLSVEAR